MSTPMLSPLALSLGLMFASQALAQAPTPGEVMTTSSAFTAEPSCTSTDNCFKKRWIYFNFNMGSKQGDADWCYAKLSALIDEAKQLGYNGIALHGSFLPLLGTPDNDHRYFNANFEALIIKARNAGIELIPVAGAPEDVAYRHSELIEAVPVNNVRFTVSGASAQAEGKSIIDNRSFENGETGWSLADVYRGTMMFDPKEGHTSSDKSIPSNTNSVKFISKTGVYSENKGVARLSRKLENLTPNTAYRVSFWMKTEKFLNDKLKFTVQVTNDKGENPVYYNFSSGLGWGTQANGKWNEAKNILKPDQDWTRYDFDFNSLDYTTLVLFFGTWSNVMESDGYAWIDEIDVREIGLPHTVVRNLMPVTVTSVDGKTTYKEGKDYKINAAQTEKLDILPAGSIPDKATLLVSSYQSAKQLISAYTTPTSTCSEEYFKEQKAIYEPIDRMFNPSKFFIYYDEWRVMNWDPACKDANAGAYLARTTAKMGETLRQVKPGLDLYIWNDMFDPNMNAVEKYFAVKGDLRSSSDNLDTSMTIVNWSVSKQTDSLKFFADKNFRQMIALYYDDTSGLLKTQAWLNSLQTAEQRDGVKGVDGFMFTTWISDYSKLKNVTELIRTKYGRYWPQEQPATPPAR